MRKVLVYYVYEQLQADLVFMDTKQTGPANQNDNYKYLLTVMDILSKYAWVMPLKDKTGKTITEAFEAILSTIKPKLLQVDKGIEFYNKNFEAVLEKFNIKMFSTNSHKKAQIIERFNRTLKLRMFKLFDSQNSFRYIDKLQNLVNNYNNTIQTTIKMKPIDVIKPENYDLLINNYYNNFPIEINSIKYEVGDVI